MYISLCDKVATCSDWLVTILLLLLIGPWDVSQQEFIAASQLPLCYPSVRMERRMTVMAWLGSKISSKKAVELLQLLSESNSKSQGRQGSHFNKMLWFLDKEQRKILIDIWLNEFKFRELPKRYRYDVDPVFHIFSFSEEF